jgi:hypothetical protein
VHGLGAGEGDSPIVDGVIPRSARCVVAIRQYGMPALAASCSLSIKPVNTLIGLQNQYSGGDFDCQNRNSLLEYIALGRSSGVIASEATQSRRT